MNDKLFSVVEVEINSHCNRSCWYCPNSISTRAEEGEMQPELFVLLLEQLRSVGFRGRMSYHFYGEPLLCSRLDEYVSLTKQYLPDVRSVLYSNGDFLDEERIAELVAQGVDRFVITQHVGKGNLLHERYEFLPTSLKDKVVKLSYKELELSNRGGTLKSIPNKISQSTPCFVPSTLVVVSVLGNVIPCFDDYHQKYVMGNITRSHIRDIWNSEPYRNFRHTLRNGERESFSICKNCNNVSVSSDEQFDYVL